MPPSPGSTSSVTTCSEAGLTIDANSSNKGSRHRCIFLCSTLHSYCKFLYTLKQLLFNIYSYWKFSCPFTLCAYIYYFFSPKSLHSPNVELTTALETVKYRLAKISSEREILEKFIPEKNTDWLWDWRNSRCEVRPPKYRTKSFFFTQVFPTQTN